MRRYTVQTQPPSTIIGQVDVEAESPEAVIRILMEEGEKLDGPIGVVLNRERVWVTQRAGDSLVRCMGAEAERRFEWAKEHRLMMATTGESPVPVGWDH